MKLPGGPDGPDLPDGAGAGVGGQGWSGRGWDTTMKSCLAWGSFSCIICLYWRHFGGGDGGYLHHAVGAGASVRDDQAEVGPSL